MPTSYTEGVQRSCSVKALLQFPDLRLNLRQRGCQRRPSCRARRSLRKNILPLQIQCLFPALRRGAPFDGQPPFFLTHHGPFRAGRFFLGGVRYLLFHRFTFPAARHIFIVRAPQKRRTALRPASNYLC